MKKIICLALICIFAFNPMLVDADYTIEQCIDIAELEISKRLPEYSNKLVFYKSYQSVMPENIDLYFHRLIKGVLSIDEKVRIGINIETGEVILFQSFLGDSTDPKVDTIPRINKEIAVCAAKDIYPDIKLDQRPELMLSGTESPILVWRIGWHNSYILINAQSGKAHSIPLVEGFTPVGEGVCSPYKIFLISCKQNSLSILVIALISLVMVYSKKKELMSILKSLFGYTRKVMTV